MGEIRKQSCAWLGVQHITNYMIEADSNTLMVKDKTSPDIGECLPEADLHQLRTTDLGQCVEICVLKEYLGKEHVNIPYP